MFGLKQMLCFTIRGGSKPRERRPLGQPHRQRGAGSPSRIPLLPSWPVIVLASFFSTSIKLLGYREQYPKPQNCFPPGQRGDPSLCPLGCCLPWAEEGSLSRPPGSRAVRMQVRFRSFLTVHSAGIPGTFSSLRFFSSLRPPAAIWGRAMVVNHNLFFAGPLQSWLCHSQKAWDSHHLPFHINLF